MDIARCRSCRAAIVWADTKNGKKMPVDADPVDNGNVVLRRRAGEPPLAVVVPPAVFDDEPRYVSHFTTCKEAGSWRRSRSS